MSESKTAPKTAILVGPTGGLGSHLSRRLAADGWKLALIARNEDKLKNLVNDLDGVEHTGVADATDAKAFKKAIDDAAEALQSVGAYIHLPGNILLKGAHMIKDEEWAETINVNLTSAFYGLRAMAGRMQKQGFGSMTFVSTVAAVTGLPAHEAIAAAKGGINAMVRSAAATYASRGVRINALAPGMTETPLAEPILKSDQGRKVSEAMHPLGRVGTADEMASAIQFLADPANGWITGQVLSVDGGLSTVHMRPKI
ncbi:MAG: SDR family NAD(P)-dependent oxidoreductase [Opitutales bacterium]